MPVDTRNTEFPNFTIGVSHFTRYGQLHHSHHLFVCQGLFLLGARADLTFAGKS